MDRARRAWTGDGSAATSGDPSRALRVALVAAILPDLTGTTGAATRPGSSSPSSMPDPARAAILTTTRATSPRTTHAAPAPTPDRAPVPDAPRRSWHSLDAFPAPRTAAPRS